MTTQKYTSFNEINQHLKVLKLRKDIAGEYCKLDMHRFRNTFRPVNLLSGFGGFVQITLLSFLTKKLVHTFNGFRLSKSN